MSRRVALPEVDPAEERSLWEALRTAQPGARERLMDLHLPFARVMAAKAYARRAHDEIEFEEYLQLAHVGLLECIDRFDPGVGASFRTYAAHRISGAILTGLETLTEKQQQIAWRRRAAAERAASMREGVDLRSGEPAALFDSLARIAVGLALGCLLEDTGMYRGGESGIAPDAGYQALELRQLQARVRALVDALPERERKLVRYHYMNQVPFESIAQMFGVSKGRVSQLHRRALELLAEELGKVKTCDIAW